MSPNHREILSAQSSITGNQEYLYSTSHALQTVVTGSVIPASTAVLNGQTTVTTAGTRVVLGAGTLTTGVIVRAKDVNAGYIYLGNSTVTSANGMILLPGESTSVAIDNLNKLFIDSASNGDGVSYIGS